MDLTQIEALAEKLYNPQNPREREMAEQSLSLPVASPEALSQCIFILEHSSSSYALVSYEPHVTIYNVVDMMFASRSCLGVYVTMHSFLVCQPF